ncbi:DNA topoisomerase IV subunit A [Pacificimonas flava]|uniref:DNA topoisomerase 4 subunit A n=2 Tax=Pacificimonas TaxID=1960290 RepID=A0A219B7I0_9SPHN|nr:MULTISPECIES: DNA topoisomerase IV subunit A [Pacificimonas]MBZ6378486.1 DNA topoisomerase IV subunit A [Pacificimonas aurantium]OWV34221.1 DNA topoisomerase IV subunit A [Pacificimonas flava]
MLEDSSIIDRPFADELSDRYLVYALSTITARSLPDVRDGLKPVHRRLLWAMRLLRLDPGSGFKKCARVVGDVIGKYHPHGDQAVYDAMVRLAQNFALRYPLVDGQGNFGNVDGDGAAAMRYTEARLTAAANALMAGLDQGTVDFRETYNGEDEEPEVFPGLFPNLLANGAAGIAVGMATSIPPHNIGEIVDAAKHLIRFPDAPTETLIRKVRGPDFPTGGVLAEDEATILRAYETGRGSLRVRARFYAADEADEARREAGIESLGGGQWQLVITDIPYQVQRSKLIEQIATLVTDRKLPILDDVRDESAEETRIVLVPKSRNVDPDILKESLYKLTDLESRFSLNLNVLDKDRTPRVMGLRDLLTAWLEFQFDMLRARTRHRLGKIDARLELLEGYLVAYLNLDRIIEIIRTEDEPKQVMMAEFSLNDRQAEAILNMRLRSLRRLEEMEIRQEDSELRSEREELSRLLESEDLQRERMKADLTELKKNFGDPRRTQIEAAAPTRDIPLEAMIEREPITVILSKRGWVRALKGHAELASLESQKFKEGDAFAQAFHAQTTDKLLVAADDGRFFTLGADKLPGGRGFGEPVRAMIDIDAEAGIRTMFVASAAEQVLLAATDGRGFLAETSELIAETRKGRQVMGFRPGAKLLDVVPVDPQHDHVASYGTNRRLLVFPLDQMPVLARGKGVMIQRFRESELAAITTLKLEEGLSWPMGGGSGRTRTETDLTVWLGSRGGTGRSPPTGFPRQAPYFPRISAEDE